MKKRFYSLLLLSATTGIAANAQVSEAGIPQSWNESFTTQVYIPQSDYQLPNWDSALKKDEEDITKGMMKSYLAGLMVNIDFSFPSSGNFETAIDGSLIWRGKIHISQAPALGFYFDSFQLPEGVQMYITNKNKTHILGAYTAFNNGEDRLFSTEALQGDEATIELNIASGMNQKDIALHINQAAVYFRGIDYLDDYAQVPIREDGNIPMGQPDGYNLEGSSSVCEINAICPEGDGYEIPRKATVQLIFPKGGSIGMCSATLVNNTGNTEKDCKKYVLTASHCEGTSSTSNTTFSNLLVRFNFENEDCAATKRATVNTSRGANFVARSKYVETQTPRINGDFLLLELTNTIPSSWDYYLAGWNNDPNHKTSETLPKKFISFHHPAGDVKKVCSAPRINPNGSAGGSDGAGTHWEITTKEGGMEQGSSGSGLFDGDGNLIGITSVAGIATQLPTNCRTNGKGGQALFMNLGAYSKISYDWDYKADGQSDIRKLKPWLDPINANVTTLGPATSACKSVSTGINIKDENKAGAIAVNLYPNPSQNGIVNAVFNLKEKGDIQIEVYSFTGTLQKTFSLKNVQNNSYALDLTELANGMYMVKMTSGIQSAYKKLAIVR